VPKDLIWQENFSFWLEWTVFPSRLISSVRRSLQLIPRHSSDTSYRHRHRHRKFVLSEAANMRGHWLVAWRYTGPGARAWQMRWNTSVSSAVRVCAHAHPLFLFSPCDLTCMLVRLCTDTEPGRIMWPHDLSFQRAGWESPDPAGRLGRWDVSTAPDLVLFHVSEISSTSDCHD